MCFQLPTTPDPNTSAIASLSKCEPYCLSGPLRLRVQSRSRTRLRIAASIAFLVRACFKSWEPVDPVVADPVRQDNDKRNNIQIYTENPYSITQREGTNLPMFISCRYLVELGPRQLGPPVADKGGFRHYRTTIARLSPPSGLEQRG